MRPGDTSGEYYKAYPELSFTKMGEWSAPLVESYSERDYMYISPGPFSLSEVVTGAARQYLMQSASSLATDKV